MSTLWRVVYLWIGSLLVAVHFNSPILLAGIFLIGLSQLDAAKKEK